MLSLAEDELAEVSGFILFNVDALGLLKADASFAAFGTSGSHADGSCSEEVLAENFENLSPEV